MYDKLITLIIRIIIEKISGVHKWYKLIFLADF